MGDHLVFLTAVILSRPVSTHSLSRFPQLSGYGVFKRGKREVVLRLSGNGYFMVGETPELGFLHLYIGSLLS